MEVKYYGNTRPKNQLEAPKQSTAAYITILQGPLLKLPWVEGLHTMLLGVDGIIYTPRTLEPLIED
eukprot:scaffold209075_cov22-Tisochrysis_lutea.AAC.1